MIPMTILTTLPNELVGAKVLIYLDVMDLVRLEASCVKGDDRRRILSSLRRMPPLNLHACRVDSSIILQWALDRRVRICRVDIACKHYVALDRMAEGNCWLDGLVINLVCADTSPIQNIQKCSIDVLKRITQLSIRGISDELPPKSLLDPIASLPGVKVLAVDIAHTSIVTVTNIFRACPNVIELHITSASASLSLLLSDHLRKIGNQLMVFELETFYLDQAIVDVVGQNCPQLQQLLLNCPDPFGQETFRDTSVDVKLIASGCPQLSSLRLAGVEATIESLEALLHNCRGLRELNLCTNFAYSAVLDVLTQASTALQCLNLRWSCVSLSTAAAGRRVWENLRVFTVRVVSANCNESLTVALRCMSNLQELTLTTIPGAETGALLDSIALTCTKLTSLMLAGSSHDPYVLSMCSIAENCANLKHFVVDWYVEITDAVLAALGRNCRQLETFCSNTDSAVSDMGLALLAQGCRWLRRLSLPQCKSLADATLIALVHNCPHLQSVEFPRCQNFSEAAVVQWVKSARKLHTLRLHRSVIGDRAVKGLRNCKGEELQLSLFSERARRGKQRCTIA